MEWRVGGTCAALLQAQSGEDFLKLGVRAELGKLDVDATAQAGAQVGWAGEDVAQVLVPHEAVVVLLEDLLDLWKSQLVTIFIHCFCFFSFVLCLPSADPRRSV